VKSFDVKLFESLKGDLQRPAQGPLLLSNLMRGEPDSPCIVPGKTRGQPAAGDRLLQARAGLQLALCGRDVQPGSRLRRDAQLRHGEPFNTLCPLPEVMSTFRSPNTRPVHTTADNQDGERSVASVKPLPTTCSAQSVLEGGGRIKEVRLPWVASIMTSFATLCRSQASHWMIDRIPL
jgi:hypothetical protein